MSSLLSLQEENRILQQELSRLEDLLAQSRAERDELAIKYNAISERVGRLPARPHKSTRFGPKTHLPSISERCRGAHNVPVMETSAPGVLGLVLRDAQSIPVPPPWCSPRCLLFCTVAREALSRAQLEAEVARGERAALDEALAQVKALDSENSKKSRELEELQARVALEEQREEESRREAFGLRRKVVESEAGMEATRKESLMSPLPCCSVPGGPPPSFPIHLHPNHPASRGATEGEGTGTPGSSPDPDAATEPEVVRAALRDFLRELQDAQREREELRVQVCSLGQRLAEAEAERDGAGARALQLQKLVAESEEGDGGGFGVDSPRLLGFGCCKQVSSPCDEKMSMVKASEAKLEEDKRRLKEGLEAAESRGARLEQQRQALEDELQRARLALGEQQAEARVLQDRAELLQRQRREAERSSLRLEKDNSALKKTLEKLAREKLKTQEDSLRLAVQKGRLHRSLGTAEQELAEAQKHIQVLRGDGAGLLLGLAAAWGDAGARSGVLPGSFGLLPTLGPPSARFWGDPPATHPVALRQEQAAQEPRCHPSSI
ncbi:Rootletin [Anas platyrhynchos]|uniref:Rootletin n=1 Tax=Anas platyrhynchos TaxID=8839 RepID=R0M197_ANAPL|nr:Rootletin [Anas platyrhynchos]